MQLPGSYHCGVSILTLSTLTNWCGETNCFHAHQENNSCGFHWLPRKLGCPAPVRGVSPRGPWLMNCQANQRGMALCYPLFSLAGVTSFAQVPSSTDLYIHCWQKTFYKPKVVMTNTINTRLIQHINTTLTLGNTTWGPALGHGLLTSGNIPVTKRHSAKICRLIDSLISLESICGTLWNLHFGI